MAKGYTQTYDIDYTETFAIVAKLNTIQVILSLALNFDWALQQFDIKNTFLNKKLEEEVFMTLPLVSVRMMKEIGCANSKNCYIVSNSLQDHDSQFCKSVKKSRISVRTIRSYYVLSTI